jgi:hypothetical protein
LVLKALVAIFPANIKNNIVVSHSGLTFGGFIVAKDEATKNSIQYFVQLLKFISEHNIEKIIFKQSPAFYSSVSQDEIDYAMFLLDAKMYRVDIAYAINQKLENKIYLYGEMVQEMKNEFRFRLVYDGLAGIIKIFV